MTMAPAYPFGLEVDEPAPQSRLTVFFRILMLIPHVIILYFLGLAQNIVTLIAWFAILFTGKYPAGLLQFSTNILHWNTRVGGYALLLTGTYPPFALGEDANYPVRLTGMGEEAGRNRLTTFFRIFMIIPHIIVFYFLILALYIVLFISWIIALFTGSVPGGMHNFMAGVGRWGTRLNAYTLLLTDKYPPFSLN
ncbi:MAG: DUF4389 domain-containing protein [Dehalococcoidia bacterium]